MSMTMTMRVVMEKHQPNNIRSETEASDYEHQLGILNLLRFDETLYSFEEDRHAEGDEEDSVHEGT